MHRFPVIIGPTASGKTALAIAVAQSLHEQGTHAEIISADSVQVYKGMDIGSAKPSPDERAAIPHRLIDVQDPRERFTVKDWLTSAEQAITEIRNKGGVPIVAGGTHLYIKALLEGLFEGPEPDAELRTELSAIDLTELRTELKRIDPAAAERIHPADRRRTVRAIEVYRLTGTPITDHQTQWDNGRREDAFVVTVVWETPELNSRINSRVKQMMAAGFLDEVRSLIDAQALGEQARDALGYKQLAAHLRGECSLEDAVERIKIDTRRFAKNQRTWLRRLGAGAEGRKSEEVSNEGSRTLTARSLAVEGRGFADGGSLQAVVKQVVEMISA